MDQGFSRPDGADKGKTPVQKRAYRLRRVTQSRPPQDALLVGTPAKYIAVTQSIEETIGDHGERVRADTLDNAWTELLQNSGCLALRAPNHPHLAAEFIDAMPIDGLLLTCGNELAAHGGDAPERDRTEFALLTHAVHRKIPVLGVGRGMQIIQRLFSVALGPVGGHICESLSIDINGERAVVNSNHRFGTKDTAPGLDVWARANDGVVKAVRNIDHRITGIMWRPELLHPFRQRDIDLIQAAFGDAPMAAKPNDLATTGNIEAL